MFQELIKVIRITCALGPTIRIVFPFVQTNGSFFFQTFAFVTVSHLRVSQFLLGSVSLPLLLMSYIIYNLIISQAFWLNTSVY